MVKSFFASSLAGNVKFSDAVGPEKGFRESEVIPSSAEELNPSSNFLL
jgi:hypothetical protein